MGDLSTEMLTSAATIVLAIIAIITFIYYGGNLIFYLVIAAAFAVGIYNAMLISKEGRAKTASSGRKRKGSGRKG